MTGVVLVALWAVLLGGLTAQLDANAGRHLLALEYRDPNVAFFEHPSRCGPDRASRDVLWGTVEGNEAESEGYAPVYEGVLQRVTEQALCGTFEQKRRAATPPPCLATLSGAGDVHVRIKVFPPADNRPAWIVITPVDVLAWATGTCPSAELRALGRAYADRITLEIPLPAGRLAPGRFDGERDASGGRWTLYVADLAASSDASDR